MDVKIVNSILTSFTNTFQTATNNMGVEIKKPKVSTGEKKFYEVVVSIGFTGDIKGNIILGLSENSAKAIASKMMMGMPVNALDEMAVSAIGELGNMLAGSIAMGLEKLGYKINITPPSVVYGKNMIAIKEGVPLLFPLIIESKYQEEFFMIINQ